MFSWMFSWKWSVKANIRSLSSLISANHCRTPKCCNYLLTTKQNWKKVSTKRKLKMQKKKWSYDKILIDFVRSGRTGKYLALGQDARTSLRSIRMSWPRAKYFSVQPSHSVNKYIIFAPPSYTTCTFYLLGRDFLEFELVLFQRELAFTDLECKNAEKC